MSKGQENFLKSNSSYPCIILWTLLKLDKVGTHKYKQ